MMPIASIDITRLRGWVADIQTAIRELEFFAKMSLKEFVQDKHNYSIAEHHFRRALEAVLTAGTHILSRFPTRTKDYQEIITSLAQLGVFPEAFAQKNRKLASYRNRLVHLYWEVTAEELYNTIQEHLNDLKQFCEYYSQVARYPKKFNLERVTK